MNVLVTGGCGFIGSNVVRLLLEQRPTWRLVNVYRFKMPAVVSRCSNNYGPYQFPEKLIPLMIANAARDLPLPVYGDGTNVRDWIHVEDHASFEEALTETVHWYLGHREWWKRVISGESLKYYDRQYGDRFRGGRGRSP